MVSSKNVQQKVPHFYFFSPGVPVALEHVWQLREQRDDQLPALAKVHQEVGGGREEHVWREGDENWNQGNAKEYVRMSGCVRSRCRVM